MGVGDGTTTFNKAAGEGTPRRLSLFPSPALAKFEDGKIHEFQDGKVAGFQDDGRGFPRIECINPPGYAQAPLVAVFEPGESVFRAWRGEIVTSGF